MLTKDEFDLLKHYLAQHLIEISNQCLMFRARDVFNILERFIKENQDGQGRQEGDEKKKPLEEGVKQETGGEDRGTQSSSSSVRD